MYLAAADMTNSNSISEYPVFAMGLLLRTLCLGGGGGGDAKLWLQLQKAFLTNTAHVHQFLDLLEWPVLLAVFHDERGGLGADAGQGVELLRRRGIDVDGADV